MPNHYYIMHMLLSRLDSQSMSKQFEQFPPCGWIAGNYEIVALDIIASILTLHATGSTWLQVFLTMNIIM